MATEVGTLQLKVDTSGVKAAEAAVERLGDAAQDTTQKTKIMHNESKKGGVVVGDFGRKAGMAGVQLEQLAGQIAMGQNPMRALGVQAADLGFVLGAPLLGAVVGIGAAIGSVLIPMLFSASKDAEELVEQFEDLDRVFSELTIAQQTVYLADMNEKIAELNEESADAQQEINRLAEELARLPEGAPQQFIQNLVNQMLPFQAIIDTNTQLIGKMREALTAESEAEREAREEKEKSAKAREREAAQRQAELDREAKAAERFKDRILGLNDTRAEAIARKEQELVYKLDELRLQDQVSELEYQRLLTEIQRNAQAERFALAVAEEDEQTRRDEARIARLHEQNNREMEILREADEKKKESAMQTTNALLSLEDALLKGKSEKQKAGFRLAVNLMNAEKRENAKNIISNSYDAAMKAYKALAGIPFVGPALGAAAAATVLAAGVSYAAQSLSGRALGGQVRAGESYVVGERGPEILTMGSTGKITPNEAIGGGGQTVNKTANVQFNIAANDTQGFDELLSNRRGLIVSMINEAMEDQGRVGIV